MKILWLTWKDMEHPLAGGAEVVNEELGKRLARDGHEVIFLVGGFHTKGTPSRLTPAYRGDPSVLDGGVPSVERDGFKIIRLGGRWSVYWRAFRYYKKHLASWPDLVIDEMNTIPFFAKFYVRQKNLLFVHQLARTIWFYQMFFPLSLVGYLLEPIYLRLLSDRKVVTVSQSSKQDLMRNGFKAENIHIISEGIQLEPLSSLSSLNFKLETLNSPTILSLGAIRPMKRTDQILKAFELVKSKIPTAKLVIAGASDGAYGERVAAAAKQSRFAADIEITGKVSDAKKLELMQRAHVLAVTSVKEGWGLVVTEANSQGTPAVVYNADGLRDSVRDGITGLVCNENTPEDLAAKIIELLEDKVRYETLQKNGWQWSKEITFERSYKEFLEIISTL